MATVDDNGGIDKIEATGKYVVLKCVRIVEKTSNLIKTPGGIIIPGQENATNGQEVTKSSGDKTKVDMYVHSIGPLVEGDKYGFKVGDIVIANNYDLQFVGPNDDVFYALTQADSIKCVYEINE